MPPFREFLLNPRPDDVPGQKLKWFLEFWHRIKGNRSMPARDDFAPQDLKPILPFVGLTDIFHNPLRLGVRLMGTAIVSESGRDLTGQFLESMSGVDEVRSCYIKMIEAQVPYYSGLQPLTWASLNYNTSASVVAPLSADGETINMAIYCMEFS